MICQITPRLWRRSVEMWFLLRKILSALVLLMLPVVTHANDQNLRLWNTQHIDPRVCSYKYGQPWAPVAEKTYNLEIKGYSWPHAEGSAQQYVDFMQRDLNTSAINSGADKRIKQRLLQAAETKAFSKLDFEDPGGPSPSFASALVALTSSFAYDYLVSKNALTAAEQKRISAWIKQLLKNSTERSNSEDHKMQILTARLAFAAANNDMSDFTKNMSALQRKLKNMKNPYFSEDIRNNNETIQHVVIAAHIAEQNNVAFFNEKFGKFSLLEVIASHALTMRHIKDKKITTAGDDKEIARSIFRPQGNGAHLAWIPVAMAYSGDTDQGKEIARLHRDLRKTSSNPYWGLAMGLHSGCFFGKAAR